MGIQHEENAPASFGDAFSDNYLGNPDLVSKIVADFVATCEALVYARSSGLSSEDFLSSANALIKEAAGIFSGKHPDYKPIIGYHGGTLKWKLMADLGSFWGSHREKWEDDSVCVLFEYVFLMLFDAMKRSNGDDVLFEVIFKPTLQYAVQVILGIEKRAAGGESLLVKSHNSGYTKKDGTVVKPFEDNRFSKQPSIFSHYANFSKPHSGAKIVLPVAKPKGKEGASTGSLFSTAKHYPNAANHPAMGDKGKVIKINEPTFPSDPDTWDNPEAQAIFVPGGDAPAELNGVALSPWLDHPKSEDDWFYVEGQMDDLDEPPLVIPVGKMGASGCVIEEPDGRVWLVSPTNAFGGYETTYPKGKLEDELSMQANSIKECFEESGLKVEITGYLGDFKRTTSVTRLYLAKRVGGSPTAVGWESQAVRLVPRSMLHEVADHHFDAPINNALNGL